MNETPPTNEAFFAFVDMLRAKYEGEPITDGMTTCIEREVNAWLFENLAFLDCGCRLRRVSVEVKESGVVEITPERRHLECLIGQEAYKESITAWLDKQTKLHGPLEDGAEEGEND